MEPLLEDIKVVELATWSFVPLRDKEPAIAGAPAKEGS